MKRKLMSMFISATFFVITIAIATPDVIASEADFFYNLSTANTTSEQAVPYAEETIWYTRIYDGKLQRRLWSITNGCWLTDWMDF